MGAKKKFFPCFFSSLSSAIRAFFIFLKNYIERVVNIGTGKGRW